jgi:integrating conjugative element protein (TIGR03765 family)
MCRIHILIIRIWVLSCTLYFSNAIAEKIPEYSHETIQKISQKLQTHANETINTIQSQTVSAPLPPSEPSLGIFPITSHLLTPAVDQPVLYIPLLRQSIFLIGTDELSVRWLQQNITKLQAIHATGFLVQVQSQQEAEQVIKLSADLPLIPMSGDSFAQQWNIAHYPVLLMPAQKETKPPNPSH